MKAPARHHRLPELQHESMQDAHGARHATPWPLDAMYGAALSFDPGVLACLEPGIVDACSTVQSAMIQSNRIWAGMRDGAISLRVF